MNESLVSRMTGRRKGEIIMLQGWEFAHSLIAHSLTSLICSHRSNQMSYCERFAQIARDKWATVSDLLRSLRINEQMSKSLVFSERIAHSLFCSEKTSDLLIKIWLKLYFFVFKKNNRRIIGKKVLKTEKNLFYKFQVIFHNQYIPVLWKGKSH